MDDKLEVGYLGSEEKKEKIEAVIVCVNFCDYLKLTLPNQKEYFDHIIIVTDSKDEETHKFCEEENLTCVITDVFYEGKVTVKQETWSLYSEAHRQLETVEEVEVDCVFNKGRALNEGFKHLKFNEWIAIIDADTVVDSVGFEYGMLINLNKLDKKCLYGPVGRMIVSDDFLPDWQQEISQWCYSEIIMNVHGSQNIDGYFQLFHYDAVKDEDEWYPTHCPTASMCDVIFDEKIRNKYRVEKLPFVVFHLGELFTHHKGRVRGSKP